MKSVRDRAAEAFVEQSEYDSDTSREMFLFGWDAAVLEFNDVLDFLCKALYSQQDRNVELYVELLKFIKENVKNLK